MPESVTVPETSIVVAPFTIEADHPRNCELLLTSVPNVRLQSAFDGMKPAKDVRGRARVPVDQALTFASFPRIPGARLEINPAKLTYRVHDPLFGEEDMCEQLRVWLKDNNAIRSGTKVAGKPPQTVTTDVHRMKTLCREVLRLVEHDEAKVVRGPCPTSAEIAELPGKFLMNPGIRTATTQPVYEEDFAGWVDRLSQAGG